MTTKKAGLMLVVIFVALLAEVDIVKAQFQDMFRIGTRYLDETPFNPDMDILRLDEGLYLSIYVEEAFETGGANYYWSLKCDPLLGTITGGVLGPDAYDGGIYDLPNGRWGKFVYEYGPGYGPGLYADEFLYTPQSIGEVTVEFWGSGGSLTGIMELVDSIVITQVPEPMTIVLLGLGALLLHRRRVYSK